MSNAPMPIMGRPGDVMNWPMLQISYLTDPEAIGKLLPPGIEPAAEPKVRIIIYNFPVLDAPEYGCVVNIAAVCDGIEGEYTMGIAIDQEAVVYGSKERWGQPKYLAKTEYYRIFDEVHAKVTHAGYTFLEFSGKTEGPVEVPEDLQEIETNEWWVKYSRSVDLMPKSYDLKPQVVRVKSEYGTLGYEKVEGTLTLNDSPWDPLKERLPMKSEPEAMLWTPMFKSRDISTFKELDGDAFWPHSDTIGSSMWPGENGAPSKKRFEKETVDKTVFLPIL